MQRASGKWRMQPSAPSLDDTLVRGKTEAAAIIHGAIEEFSQELALVIRRFLANQAAFLFGTFLPFFRALERQ
jgi:hypothetical protein